MPSDGYSGAATGADGSIDRSFALHSSVAAGVELGKATKTVDHSAPDSVSVGPPRQTRIGPYSPTEPWGRAGWLVCLRRAPPAVPLVSGCPVLSYGVPLHSYAHCGRTRLVVHEANRRLDYSTFHSITRSLFLPKWAELNLAEGNRATPIAGLAASCNARACRATT